MPSPLQDFLYPLHKLLEDTAQRHLAQLSGTILDLGCGGSPYQRFLPEGVHYLGADRVTRQDDRPPILPTRSKCQPPRSKSSVGRDFFPRISPS